MLPLDASWSSDQEEPQAGEGLALWEVEWSAPGGLDDEPTDWPPLRLYSHSKQKQQKDPGVVTSNAPSVFSTCHLKPLKVQKTNPARSLDACTHSPGFGENRLLT